MGEWWLGGQTEQWMHEWMEDKEWAGGQVDARVGDWARGGWTTVLSVGHG